jgi:hypothetical protein
MRGVYWIEFVLLLCSFMKRPCLDVFVLAVRRLDPDAGLRLEEFVLCDVAMS